MADKAPLNLYQFCQKVGRLLETPDAIRLAENTLVTLLALLL